MDEIIKTVKTLPKQVLLLLILGLMEDGIIEYHELTQLHIEHLEKLRKGTLDDYWRLQQKVSKIWIDYKKNRDTNIKSVMQYLMDKGTLNITQEQIDKY